MGVVEYLSGARHRAHVLRRTDLFGEEQMQRLDLAQDDRRDGRAGPRMEVDGKIQVRTQTFAKHLHVLDRALSLAPVSTHSSRSGNWNLSAVTPAAFVLSRNSRASDSDQADA